MPPEVEMIAVLYFQKTAGKKEIDPVSYHVRATTKDQACELARTRITKASQVLIREIVITVPAKTTAGWPNDGWSYSPTGARLYDPDGYCDNPARGY